MIEWGAKPELIISFRGNRNFPLLHKKVYRNKLRKIFNRKSEIYKICALEDKLYDIGDYNRLEETILCKF